MIKAVVLALSSSWIAIQVRQYTERPCGRDSVQQGVNGYT